MRRVALFLWLLVMPAQALAQMAATLVADQVTLNGRDQLIASGNVEVFYQGTALRAARLLYDQPSDSLTITGPIVITGTDGAVYTAAQATLDPRLENGILLGARLVLDRQVQLAANQINQTDGRFTQFYKTTASSCQVCGTEAPLWEIRAERAIRDGQELQLYFENATFLVRGLPIFWLPSLRLPDPALTRSAGFLIPRQRNTTQLGIGFKIPYFIPLGDHADITVTPYTSLETTTLELVYRQAFHNGDLRVRAAASSDTLLPENRSYLFAEADFALPLDYKLRFDIEAVSDPAYLLDYGYSGKDRLDSAVDLRRITDTSLSLTNLTYYQTLRDDEVNSSLPPIVASTGFEIRSIPRTGAVLTLQASADTAYRYSDLDGDAGRDVTRAGVQMDWRQDWISDAGLVTSATLGTRADLYQVADDRRFDRTLLRLVPTAELRLRYPLLATSAGGTAHLLEPAISLGWAQALGDTPPNEDSTRSEFDRANLFDTQRFTGDDVVETGAQTAIGLTWTRTGAAGDATVLAFGRVYRDGAQSGFTPSSGLDGNRSDWLAAGQIDLPGGLIFDARALLDDSAEVTRADGRIGWRNSDISLAAAYIWQEGDIIEDRPETVAEWTFDAGFQISDAWSLSLDARYDVAADRPVRGAIGLGWRNECVTIDVSASRRYTSSSTVDPTTTFGLSGSLTGFSAGRSQRGPAAACR